MQVITASVCMLPIGTVAKTRFSTRTGFLVVLSLLGPGTSFCSLASRRILSAFEDPTKNASRAQCFSTLRENFQTVDQEKTL